jgi:hypothetical protein
LTSVYELKSTGEPSVPPVCVSIWNPSPYSDVLAGKERFTSNSTMSLRATAAWLRFVTRARQNDPDHSRITSTSETLAPSAAIARAGAFITVWRSKVQP